MANSLSVVINGKEFVSPEAKKAGDSLSTLHKASDTAMNAMATGAKVAAGAFTAAVGAVGALTASAVKVAGVGDNIDKMSQKLGMSREAYQEWDFIMSQSGSSVDSLQASMKTLADAAVEASNGSEKYAGTFDALGVSVTDANGKMKNQETLFNEIVVALSGVEDTTTRTALASDLLGKSATELGPLLNGGSDALDNMRSKAHELGLVISDETVDAGVRLTDTMDQMKRVMATVGAEAIGPLLPALDSIGQAFIGLVKGTDGAGEQFASSVSDFIQAAMDGLVDMAPQIVDIGTQVLSSLITGISGSTDTLGEAITNIVISLVNLITANLPTVVAAAFKIVKAIGKGLVEAAPQMAVSIGFMMADMGTQIASLAKDFIGYGKNIIQGLIQGIKSMASAPIEAVKEVGNKIKEGFKDLFGIHSPSRVFAEFGEFFMLGLAEGIKNNDGVVADALKNAIGPLNTDEAVSVAVSGSGGGGETNSASSGGGFFGIISQFAGCLGGMITSLSSIQSLLDPISTILSGVMEMLGPAINDTLAPLVGILKIVGNVIGSMLVPVIQILTPIIEFIGQAFVWLYNKAIVPLANGFIWVINMVRIGFAKVINGIIDAINWIPGVNIGHVSVGNSTDGMLSAIDYASISQAGWATGSSYAGSGSGSSTSVQQMTINIYQTFDGPVIGDGGLESVGHYVVGAIQAYAGVGGAVTIVGGAA